MERLGAAVLKAKFKAANGRPPPTKSVPKYHVKLFLSEMFRDLFIVIFKLNSVKLIGFDRFNNSMCKYIDCPSTQRKAARK